MKVGCSEGARTSSISILLAIDCWRRPDPDRISTSTRYTRTSSHQVQVLIKFKLSFKFKLSSNVRSSRSVYLWFNVAIFFCFCNPSNSHLEWLCFSLHFGACLQSLQRFSPFVYCSINSIWYISVRHSNVNLASTSASVSYVHFLFFCSPHIHPKFIITIRDVLFL